MAYSSANLSAIAYANGFTLWHYRTDDAANDVDTRGYFNAAAGMLRMGDFIFLNAGGSASPSFGVMVVVANDNSSVDVTNLTPFGTSNSD